MSLADDFNLRLETARMNDMADFVDLFDVPQSWTPTLSVTAPMTIGSQSVLYSVWYQVGDLNKIYMRATATLGGTSRYQVFATLPVTPPSASYHPLICNYRQPIAGGYVIGCAFTDGASITISKADGSEFTADTIDINIWGEVRT